MSIMMGLVQDPYYTHCIGQGVNRVLKNLTAIKRGVARFWAVSLKPTFNGLFLHCSQLTETTNYLYYINDAIPSFYNIY